MPKVRQRSLRDNHIHASGVALGTSGPGVSIVFIASPMSGWIKSVTAVAHGGGINSDVTITFFVNGAFMVDSAGSTAELVLKDTDDAGDVTVLEFPDVIKNRILEAEAGDILTDGGVLVVTTDGNNGVGETYSFTATIQQ